VRGSPIREAVAVGMGTRAIKILVEKLVVGAPVPAIRAHR